MDQQEIKDRILAAINGLIKDETEEADKALHDVLAAKMKDRLGVTQEPGTSTNAPEHEEREINSIEDVPDDDTMNGFEPD